MRLKTWPLHASAFPLFVSLFLALAVTGCGPEMWDQLDEINATGEPITDGTTDTGHASVGWLHIDSSTLCTATLVGSKTVLTAAHCIKTGKSHVFYVGSGSYTAASTHPHPQFNSTTKANDIALVKLSTAPSVLPSIISELAPTVGTAVTLVGYGLTGTGNNDAGTKRTATNTVSNIYTSQFRFNNTGGGSGNTCHGDSGGPAFATMGGREVVLGTTIGGPEPCGQYGVDSRVDYYKAWLKTTSGGDLDGTCSGVTLASNPAGGGNVSAGTTVAFTASSACGAGTPEVVYRGYTASGGWKTIRPWSTTSTFNWDTTSVDQTTHTVMVWVRIKGSGTAYQALSQQQTYTVTASGSGSCSSVSINGNPISGSSVDAGNKVSFTATSTCSGGTAEYVYRGYTASGGWKTIRPWSTTPNFDWDTSAAELGAHTVMVWVRIVGSGVAYHALSGYMSYTIASPPAGSCSTLSLTGNPLPGGIVAGTPVSLTATAACGTGTPEYVYRHYDAVNGWKTIRPWSTSNTFTYDTTTADAGINTVMAWVRIVGSGVAYQALSPLLDYTVSLPANGTCVSVNMIGNPAAGALIAGTSVSFTATASCGAGTKEYVFRGYDTASGWKTLRRWSTSNTFTWDTSSAAAGANQVMVWVRMQGDSLPWQAQSLIQTYTISGPASGSCSALSLAGNPTAGAITAGAQVAFTATATCGTGTPEYVYRAYTSAGGWKTIRPWSTTSTFTWDTTSVDATTHTIMAWVRIQGSGVAYQALSQYLAYTISN